MKWIKNIRTDAGKVEWICEHGVGHTDPRSTSYTVHGCDGCCSRPDFPPTVSIPLAEKTNIKE